MDKIGVIGAGTMGHGIAQVCGMAGYAVMLNDVDQGRLDHALLAIERNLEKGVAKGKVEAEIAARAMANLDVTTSMAELARDVDVVIEAVPEKLDLKQQIFSEVARHAPDDCIFATNTSSLSVEAIASAVPDPGQVLGAHFFNPVHIMKLLEVVITEQTKPKVLHAIKELGAEIGKEVIVVRDVPGFATSRLGVCLGMEAIRMVESNVASAEDIDKAMVLGYRHPIGPLRLTDLVGLDVRMHIGEYLAKELDNPAFEPPELMRKMVERGQLGKKSGKGFYEWD